MSQQGCCFAELKIASFAYVSGKKHSNGIQIPSFLQMPASYRSSSFTLLPTTCTEPKYFLFGTPGHWLNEKQDREGREECSILFHVIKIAVIYLHILAPSELPIYLSVLRLSSLEALHWKGTVSHCALQVDSVPHVAYLRSIWKPREVHYCLP